MKKSVLFVTPYFYPRIGGVETHVYQIAKVLISRGWHVSILTQEVEGSTKKSELKLQLHTIKLENKLDKREVWRKIEPFSKELPMEYAVELNKLLELEMKGSIG